ncbi:MAG: glycosyltransferase family 4 protein [Pseudomonadota bacterium]
MRIAFLSQRFLMPMDTGGKIRTGNILEQLNKKHDITWVGNYNPRKDEQYREDISRFCQRFIPVEWNEPERGSPRFYARLAKNLCSTFPVTALNDYSPELEQALLETLAEQEFDLAICDFVQSALLFRQVKNIPTLLFTHNVEAKIFERHLDAAGNPATQLLWWSQQKRMARFEKQSVHKFDRVIAVSDNDAAIFEREYGADNAVSIPTGVDIDFYQPGDPEKSDPHNIVFCGSMDWLPNEDGMKFFLTEIAGLLDARLENWSLTIVGRNPSDAMQALAGQSPNVTLTGWVDDVRTYLETAGVCIVPLRIGGGTRMKIYEAMAMGKAVVATTVGAEGLEGENGRDICLVDQPTDIAEAIVELVLDHDKRRAMEQSARRLVEENFSWARVADRFSEICNETIEVFESKQSVPELGPGAVSQ